MKQMSVFAFFQIRCSAILVPAAEELGEDTSLITAADSNTTEKAFVKEEVKQSPTAIVTPKYMSTRSTLM